MTSTKWLIFLCFYSHHLQNWTIDLLLKNPKFRKHVVNFKTPPLLCGRHGDMVSNSSNFMKFWYFSWNLSGINILDSGFFLKKLKLVFVASALFHNHVFQRKTVLVFILRCFQLYLSPQGIRKTYIHFSNIIFLPGTHFKLKYWI